VSVEDGPDASSRSRLLNNYTLTMDVMLDRQPMNPISLFQAMGNLTIFAFDFVLSWFEQFQLTQKRRQLKENASFMRAVE
jgi:hypothetical protein